MRVPKSFCTICTNSCVKDLIGLILSLSIFYPDYPLYILCDSTVKKTIKNITPRPRVNITWVTRLNHYKKYKREELKYPTFWNDLMASKTSIMLEAMEEHGDTMYLDADTILFHVIEVLDEEMQMGICRSRIRKEKEKDFGKYNHNMIWLKDKEAAIALGEYIKQNKSKDAVELLTKDFTFFEYTENYNMHRWRLLIGDVPNHIVYNNLNYVLKNLYYGGKRLVTINISFTYESSDIVLDIINDSMRRARCYKQLAIVDRIISNSWVLTIPNQPMKDKWLHDNKGFRELVLLLKSKNRDVEKELNNNEHCILKPNLLLYDRPSMQWLNKKVLNSSFLLLGNCSEKELKKFTVMGIKIMPWIFWPSSPVLIEETMKRIGNSRYIDRTYKCVYANSRFCEKINCENWVEAIDFHNTNDYSYDRYLCLLANSRFSLCLKGKHQKSRRVIESMAMGTVPIVHKDVNMTCFYDPPLKKKHYFEANTTEDVKKIINETKKEEWEEMSANCVEWYMKNVHSDNCWDTMIEKILYG